MFCKSAGSLLFWEIFDAVTAGWTYSHFLKVLSGYLRPASWMADYNIGAVIQ